MRKIIHRSILPYIVLLLLINAIIAGILLIIIVLIYYWVSYEDPGIIPLTIGDFKEIINNLSNLIVSGNYLESHPLNYVGILVLYLLIFSIVNLLDILYLNYRFVSVKPSVLRHFHHNSGPWIDFGPDPESSIRINWITAKKTPSVVLFGKDPERLEKVGDFNRLEKIHHVIINDLKPDVRYYYKLYRFDSEPVFCDFNYKFPIKKLGALKNNLGKNGPNKREVIDVLNGDIYKDVHSFVIPDFKTIFLKESPGQNFNFIVLGDTQNGGGYGVEDWALRPIINTILGNQEYVNTNAIFSVGDVVDQGNDLKSWHAFLSHISLLADSRPLQIAVGNHDTGTNYLADKSQRKYPDDGANFDAIFAYQYNSPKDEDRITAFKSRYYKIVLPGLLLLFLDSQNSKLAEPQNPQWSFIKDALSHCPEEYWRIIFIHRPLVELKSINEPSSGRTSISLEQTAYGQYILPILEELPVDVVIGGHAHVFSALLFGNKIGYRNINIKKLDFRSQFPVFHIISGGAGDNLRKNPPQFCSADYPIKIKNDADNKFVFNDNFINIREGTILKSIRGPTTWQDLFPYRNNISHFLYVSLSKKDMIIKAINADGEVIWEISLSHIRN